MSSAWPEEAVWLRVAAPMIVLGAMPLAAMLTPGFVLWRHAVAGPMLATGLGRAGAAPAPYLRAVAPTEAPERKRPAAPTRRRRAGPVTLAAVPDAVPDA
ncbi:hypothetical protein [Histidinibacterium lentulum]|uniref:Uncharacterized protein n=1 Tax=Histidinibacterium lentulum TaxID=2480588 RepID=A0A3N2QTK0_9RHOB|nr:hypothetical protein [Histidinibacterium lentulum]ROT98523.1 hypothetical protein EAT49_16405 [Histidinibacterium lentulum]